MINRIRVARQEFPRQFWLLFWGVLISTFGGSMIWPFLMIYVSNQLNLPLLTIGSLLTINSVTGLIFSFIGGPVIDRVGRKWVMVISLIGGGIANILMSQAHSYLAFAILMVVSGGFGPLMRTGADAMMADLVPPDKRADAYSLLRMSNNVGVALGPAVGGFVTATSYTGAFLISAAGGFIYAALMAFLGRETLPSRETVSHEPTQSKPEKFGGYGRIFKDTRFISFVFGFALNQVCAGTMWIMLSVYTKTNFGLSERLYGWIPTTNALMVVFLQIYITQFTKRRPPLLMLALGALFYATALASVAVGRGFWWFWLCMVVMSIGELVIVPTATTFAANAAPTDMRGRYMSLYGLAQGMAMGVSPLLAGYLNDTISPAFIWYGAGMVGFMAVATFLILSRRYPAPREVKAVTGSSVEGDPSLHSG